jgi:hypothetical protein
VNFEPAAHKPITGMVWVFVKSLGTFRLVYRDVVLASQRANTRCAPLFTRN